MNTSLSNLLKNYESSKHTYNKPIGGRERKYVNSFLNAQLPEIPKSLDTEYKNGLNKYIDELEYLFGSKPSFGC